MTFAVGCDTTKGNYREENQDSFFARYTNGHMAQDSCCMAVLCDGMGGLAEGNVASQSVTYAMEKWYRERFEMPFSSRLSIEKASQELQVIIRYCHSKLNEYGRNKEIRLGTTLALVLLYDSRCLIMNIGDSRVYRLRDTLSLMTRDDTVAAQMTAAHRMTEEEAHRSRERHILTQCIGVGEQPQVHIVAEPCRKGDVYFVCSDGMYHCLTDEEISQAMCDRSVADSEHMTETVRKLMKTVTERGERDNITGVLLSSIE